MPISMSTDARYVTQSSVYDCPILGPLTSRRINQYKKQGRFQSNDIRALHREKLAKARKAVSHRRAVSKELDAFFKL